jgi:hypothetical protein
MRRILLIISAVLVLGLNLNAQKFSVTGTLQDTLKEPMAGATIVLLNASDSVLYKFGVSALSGTFTIKRVVAGDYILQATFVGYQTFNKNISVKENTNVGALTLQYNSQNLGELTVEADAIPLEVRNDTIAYNADAFKTQPGAVVEDLLKRLPGVEVEKDGTVKAQGEEVTKVVVDGKEFFGTDPQTATKNLPADAIDKVEVYDEMSDEADFTGVDDGQRTKTINLTLKKDRKKGYFGNFEAGYGTEERFKARANVNRFNTTTQTSFIGMVNNNNEQGFSIRDYADFMGGFQNIGGGRRGRFNSNDLGLPISDGVGNGFITTGAGGLNLNHEFKKESTLNVSYFYTNIMKDLDRTIDREYIFGESRPSTFYEQADTQQSSFQNHNIRSVFRHKINDNNSLIWRGTFGYNAAEYDNTATNKNLTSENILSNDAMSDYDSQKNTLKYNTSLTLRHKFEKKGRSITGTGSFNNQDSEQDANLISNLNFYNPDSTTIINQTQVDNNQNLNYQVRTTYTEPLGKRRYLSVQYNHRNYSRPLDKTFTDNVTGTIIDSLNVNYENDYLYHQAGLNLRVIKGKSNLQFGVDGQYSALKGEIKNRSFDPINQSFYFLLPSLRWRYELGQSHNIRVSYRTSANEPDMIELQPILDNSNPLSLYIGDPSLQPEYTHRMNVNYLNFDQFTFSSFFANLTATYTTNKIATITAIDRSSAQIRQPINVDYNMTLRGFASYSTPIRAIKSRIRLNVNSTVQRSLSPIANIENVNNYLTGIPTDLIEKIPQTRYNTSGRIAIENRQKDIVDISGGVRLTYNNTVFEQGNQASQSFFQQNYFAELLVNVGKNWAVSTELDYTIYEGSAVGTRQAVPIWQANLRHYFLKNRRAELRLSAYDILNKNVGINWTSNFNYTQEEVINSLGRYFMLSFKYQLIGVGGK